MALLKGSWNVLEDVVMTFFFIGYIYSIFRKLAWFFRTVIVGYQTYPGRINSSNGNRSGLIQLMCLYHTQTKIRNV